MMVRSVWVRRSGYLLLLTLGGLLLRFPVPVVACDWTDMACHRDSAFYTLQQGVTEILWLGVRGLLLAARIIEGFRVWLVVEVLGAVLERVLRGLEGPFVLAVVLAVMIVMLSFFVQTFLDLNWVDLRRALRNGGIAVIIFFYGADMAAALEAGRVEIGALLSQLAAESVAATTVGVQTYSGAPLRTEVVAPPTPIYADDPCGVGATRPESILMLNDLVANYLFAAAPDIHCPNRIDGDPALPIAFWDEATYADGTNTPGYFAERQIETLTQEPERRGVINAARDGVTRMSFGIPLALMAVLEQVLHLLYAVALMAVWFGMALSLAFSLYVPLDDMFTTMVRALITVLRQSLLGSLWLGIGSAVLQTVIGAPNSNGLIVGGVGILMLVLVGWFAWKAALLLMVTLGSVSSTTMAQAPLVLAGAGATMLGVGGALAGVGMARAWRYQRTYQQAEQDFANTYGDDLPQQQAAAQAYATAQARQAVNPSVMGDMAGLVRGGIETAALAHRPVRTALRWIDKRPASVASAPDLPDSASLTATDAGHVLAHDANAPAAQELLARLQGLAATAKRDGAGGTATAMTQVQDSLFDLGMQHDTVYRTYATPDAGRSLQTTRALEQQLTALDRQMTQDVALQRDIERLIRQTARRRAA